MSTELTQACMDLEYGIIRTLIQSGCNVHDVSSEYGVTPLMMITQQLGVDEDWVEMLLNAGAHRTINDVDQNGDSALLNVLVMGRCDLITLLVEYGAVPDEATLDYAQRKRPELLHLLTRRD